MLKYFDPENYESILNSILSIVYSEFESDKLKRYGREQIKKFNWRIVQIKQFKYTKN